MADLVRQHADDRLAIVFGEVDEFIRQDDRPVGQCKGVGADRPALAEVKHVAVPPARRIRRDVAKRVMDREPGVDVQPCLFQHRCIQRCHGALAQQDGDGGRRHGDGHLDHHRQGESVQAPRERGDQGNEDEQARPEALQPVDQTGATPGKRLDRVVDGVVVVADEDAPVRESQAARDRSDTVRDRHVAEQGRGDLRMIVGVRHRHETGGIDRQHGRARTARGRRMPAPGDGSALRSQSPVPRRPCTRPRRPRPRPSRFPDSLPAARCCGARSTPRRSAPF